MQFKKRFAQFLLRIAGKLAPDLEQLHLNPPTPIEVPVSLKRPERLMYMFEVEQKMWSKSDKIIEHTIAFRHIAESMAIELLKRGFIKYDIVSDDPRIIKYYGELQVLKPDTQCAEFAKVIANIPNRI